MGRPFKSIGFVFTLIIWGLMGCNAAPSTSEAPPSQNTSDSPGVIVTVAPLPTLYPTDTPQALDARAQFEPAATPADRPTRAPTSTPVDLNEPVLTVDLQIPALGFSRSISGNVAGAATITDQVSGQEIILARSGRLLAELRAALLEANIEQLPAAGCDTCVQISFALPADGVELSGWLRDPILTASLEFLFTNSLGPHFPEGTQIGFYRSASGYTVSQTVVIFESGETLRWSGPDEQLDQSPIDLEITQQIVASIPTLPLRLWEDSYTADCTYYPLEILRISTAGGGREIDIQCPELSLPTTLIPFYNDINALTADLLAEDRNLPFPDQPLPLDALVFYIRPDGASLTLFETGLAQAISPTGEPAETIIPLEFVTPLVADLTNSEVLPRGVKVLTDPQNEQNYEELLLVRGELGVYEFPWRDRVAQGLIPGVASLETLLIDLVGPLIEPTITPTIDPQPIGTVTPTLDPSTNPGETVTITPTIPGTATATP